MPFTARIGRPPLHRGGSASKKGTWPLLYHPSATAPLYVISWPLDTSVLHRGSRGCCRSHIRQWPTGLDPLGK